MTLFDDLISLKAGLHSINVDLGNPTYRTIAIRKTLIPTSGFVPYNQDYLLNPKCKITNVLPRYVNESFSNGTLILSQDDLMVHNMPRIYTLDFLKSQLGYYIIDPVIQSNKIVSGIRCELIGILEDNPINWKIFLRKHSDRQIIEGASLQVMNATLG